MTDRYPHLVEGHRAEHGAASTNTSAGQTAGDGSTSWTNDAVGPGLVLGPPGA
jgi:hypothetical protein